MTRTAVRIVGSGLALGATVVASWVAVRGRSVLTGPGPFHDSSWLAIWAIEAALVSVIGLAIGRTWGRHGSARVTGGIVLAAWLGELVLVSASAPFLAGELSPVDGPTVWLVGTGGFVLPLAALSGALVGLASIRVASTPPNR